MPEFEVAVRYALEYSALKLVTAKNEKEASDKVNKALGKISSLKELAKYIGRDSNIDVTDENLETDGATEV